MKFVIAVTILCTIAMGVALVYGFGFGGGWGEVRVLMDYPWFVVSLVDVYVGFIFFAFWIAAREKPVHSIIWILLLMTLGNIIACIYLLYAIKTAKPLPLTQSKSKAQTELI
ncbi:MAG: DUF1475 family protein [Phycisphaerales bacterium]|nr:DUF1475 family protein [Phycisphaerales bacterium]